MKYVDIFRQKNLNMPTSEKDSKYLYTHTVFTVKSNEILREEN